jgi:CelD/BcsL family acetyltransferase involved in cellulose biosynthesis
MQTEMAVQRTRSFTTNQLRINLVTDFAQLDARRAEWNALAARSATNTIFQTYEWHASWWRAFGADYEAVVLLVEEGDELVGIAPLMRSRQRVLGFRQQVVEFIGAPLGSDYCDFIVPAERSDVLKRIVEWLLSRRQHLQLLVCSDLPEASPTLAALAAYGAEYGWHAETKRLYGAPTRIFNNPEEDQKLPKKKSLVRHHNYFKRNGTLTFEVLTEAAAIEPHLATFFAQHIARRALTEHPSQFLDERQQVFYRELVRALAPTGWLHFAVVRYNDAPLAYHLGFVYGGRFIWYKPTFDVAYAEHSPGEVLLKFLLEQALALGVDEFDFTIGEESFKYRFANHERSNHQLRLCHQPILHHSQQMIAQTRAFLHRSPQLLQFVRNVRGALPKFGMSGAAFDFMFSAQPVLLHLAEVL